ncbi:MAG: hypothetical protein NTX50_31450 [Candidatus Sumerlaeota bacterium]|nr:hypothetical protein [Candidatus Sumerlaeota bacterium]
MRAFSIFENRPTFENWRLNNPGPAKLRLVLKQFTGRIIEGRIIMILPSMILPVFMRVFSAFESHPTFGNYCLAGSSSAGVSIDRAICPRMRCPAHFSAKGQEFASLAPGIQLKIYEMKELFRAVFI